MGSLAKARRLSLSDFVRQAVLRGTGSRLSTRCRGVAADDAAVIRRLSDIAARIRSLTTIARAQRTIDETELPRCLNEIASRLARLAV